VVHHTSLSQERIFPEVHRSWVEKGFSKAKRISGHELKETQASYSGHFGCEKAHLSHENALSLCIYDEISI